MEWDGYNGGEIASKTATETVKEYIEKNIEQTNEEKEFEVRFNYSRVDKAQIEIVNELPQNTEERQIISDPEMSMAMVISALILLINFG